MESLTDEEREKVLMMQSVSNSHDTAHCISLLRSCDWRVDDALATHFAIDAAAGGNTTAGSESATTTTASVSPRTMSAIQAASAGSPPVSTPPRHTGSDPLAASTIRSSAAASPSVATPLSSSPSTSSVSSTPASASKGWFGRGLVSSSLGVVKRMFGAGGSAAPATAAASSSSSSRPQTAQESFIASLRAQYPNLPECNTGSYTDAVRAAKTNRRLLFLYLHCASHDDTDTFVRETLCHESMRNFLREHFEVWIGSIKHTEVYRLSIMLGVASFPFIALLAPQGSASLYSSSAAPASSASVAVVFRHTGLISSEALLSQLLLRKETYEQIEGNLEAQRVAEQAEVEQARTLREQQDQEYMESLLMDQGMKEAQEREAREMEELARQTREAEAKAAEDRRRHEEEEARRKEEAELERQAKAATLPPEPTAGGPAAVNISIRLPTGKKVQRRFRDTDHLSTVHSFVQSQEDMASLGEQYNILSNFPRTIHSDPNVEIGSLKLGKQILFLVESTVEEEDDEDEEGMDQ